MEYFVMNLKNYRAILLRNFFEVFQDNFTYLLTIFDNYKNPDNNKSGVQNPDPCEPWNSI